jgi:hypothetical protein
LTTKTFRRPPGAADLLNTVRLYDDGDSWGVNMGWLFAIAHVLTHCTAEEIPPDWGYRDAPACRMRAIDFTIGAMDDTWDHEEGEIINLWPTLPYAYTDGTVDHTDRRPEDALLYVGAILARYDTWLRLAGRNY